ncbi:hypothetical protein [Pedobacter sp. Leaf170]|uniref:hypothetical protein n=1 Tax=Pedobacter sp. Leaf170 TaxID=2876558 RepID=UPI001E5CEAA3|nr:hypothetical protein [Pedobacter sp. Leaf170]
MRIEKYAIKVLHIPIYKLLKPADRRKWTSQRRKFLWTAVKAQYRTALYQKHIY